MTPVQVGNETVFGRKWPDRLPELIAMLDRGDSIARIAEHYGCGHGTVYKACYRYGLKERLPKRMVPWRSRREELRAMIERGETHRSIALHFGCAEMAVSTAAHNYGFKQPADIAADRKREILAKNRKNISAWCPEALRPFYHKLVKQGYKAAEARGYVEQEIARLAKIEAKRPRTFEERLERARRVGITERQFPQPREYDFSLTGAQL